LRKFEQICLHIRVLLPLLSLANCAKISLTDLQTVTTLQPCKTGTISPLDKQFVQQPDVYAFPPNVAETLPRGPFSRRLIGGQVQAFAPDFQAYSTTILASENNLPAALQNSNDRSVETGIYQLLIKASATAQLHANPAYTPAFIQEQQRQINASPAPDSFTYNQISHFARDLFSLANNPSAAPSASFVAFDRSNPAGTTVATPATPSKLVTYITQYYQGNYVDRFGVKITKPTLGTTVSDAEITGAFTILLDYIMDLKDPTPVFGDTANPAGATFYPGKSKDEPTALLAKLATYKQIPANSLCGVTQANISTVYDFASAAGDEAGTVGGLVGQTAGGWELGLGVMGKISIGDNKTLSDLAQTLASRVAQRVTYAGFVAVAK
jgi:hypothetical protein